MKKDSFILHPSSLIPNPSSLIPFERDDSPLVDRLLARLDHFLSCDRVVESRQRRSAFSQALVDKKLDFVHDRTLISRVRLRMDEAGLDLDVIAVAIAG